jgi:hypothetical protein
MEGIGHYEDILAELHERRNQGTELNLVDRLDYYIAAHRIAFRKI